jgi:peptide/nickel transport system permease protein
MWTYLGKRLGQMLITLLLFQIVTYLLIDAQPGDIADLLTLNPAIPPAESQRMRSDLGLDLPPVQRMVRYIVNFYRGDLGRSFQQYPTPVVDMITERLPRTLVLFAGANLIAFGAGYASGKTAAWRRGGLVEYGATIAGVTLYTVFLPAFALMMIFLFGVVLRWLPTGKFVDPLKWLNTAVTTNQVFIWLIVTGTIVLAATLAVIWLSNGLPQRSRLPVRVGSALFLVAAALAAWILSDMGGLAWDILSHLFLPLLTLSLYSYAGTMLLMRTSMLGTLREDYILTARAKGLPEPLVRDRHAARNALLPVWTGLVFGLSGSVGGVVVIEAVFSWPGLGLALLDAALNQDIPVAMGILTTLGILTLVAHLGVDMGYAFLDPRIRFASQRRGLIRDG